MERLLISVVVYIVVVLSTAWVVMLCWPSLPDLWSGQPHLLGYSDAVLLTIMARILTHWPDAD